MPKTTLASVLFGLVTLGAAIALTVIEWADELPVSARLRPLIHLACAAAVLLSCGSSALPQASHQYQPVTVTVLIPVTVTALENGAQR